MLGVNEHITEENAFNIYPNPASDQAKIKFNKTPEESFHVVAYDVLGKKANKFFVKKLDYDQKINVSLNQFKQGTYFIVIKTQDKKDSEKLLVTYL
ncbi:MAG: T9SS type A sorting domain-containing protein [Bacteroidota bacterium]|nr:T9SS type A sorting domain-containing protein [Bacteroidota bacterium]